MILALDLSGSTGWCVGKPGAEPTMGLWRLPSCADPGRQAAAFADVLADAITVHTPTLVIMEVDVSLHRQNPDATAYQQIGMAYLCDLLCWRRDTRLRRATAADARMAMLGRSKWPQKGGAKVAVMNWCREEGISVADHNIADSYLLWRFACASLELRSAA